MPPPAEISIPTTSISAATHDTKSYTLYNITLRLPLRSFVVQKRYSEFATLHTTLSSLTGNPPPAPLPAKSWFKSTVSSTDLTEQRRASLEKYLRAIAESPDRSWRDTSAWRAFLNLPSSSSTTASNASTSGIGVEGRIPTIGLAAANAAAAADSGTWLDLHKEMKKALHDARLHLARRDAAAEGGSSSSGTSSISSTAAVEAGAAAKRELIKAGSLLSALGDGLRALQEAGRLGEGEIRRRRDLCSAARVEKDSLEKLSASLASNMRVSRREGGPSTADKVALVGAGPRQGGRVLGAPLPETESTRELDNEGVVQLQRRLMEDQDQDVESLARIVRRQKEMGLAIKDEVDMQTQMLDQLDLDMNRADAKIKVAKDRARKLGG